MQSASTWQPKNKDQAALSATWHPAWLLVAPHRLAFFLAGLLLALTALWWALVLGAQAMQLPLTPALPLPLAHGLLMSLSAMPMFMAGFLFTAGPKWLGLGAVKAPTLLPALVAMLVGWATALTGFHLHTLLAAAGVGVVAIGWSALSLRLTGLVRRSLADDRLHLGLVAVACLCGASFLWLAAAALALGQLVWLRSATQMGLWWFLAPVFAVMSHRMVPFFGTSALPALDAWRPLWLLWTMLTALWLEGLISVVNLWFWPQAPLLRWLQVAAEAPMAMLLLGLAMRWAKVQNLKIRMLAMLHGGFVWLGVFFALQAASHWRMAQSGDAASLGLAPLHALTMGYLGITLFAMVTRVSSGHGGRAEPADPPAWTLYWVLQVAVVLRVVAALTVDFSGVLTLFSVCAWCVAMVSWALRYSHWFGTPRPDGRPG
jgi:uncharacterized protein involved in response to NO